MRHDWDPPSFPTLLTRQPIGMRAAAILSAVALLPLTLAAKSAEDALLELEDGTLEDALAKHDLMLVNIGVPNCGRNRIFRILGPMPPFRACCGNYSPRTT